MRLLVTAEMQRRHAAEDVRRPVDRIVVQERTAALQFVLEIRQLAATGATVLVVLASDRYADPVPGWHHDRCWPNLDIELHDVAGFEPLFLSAAADGIGADADVGLVGAAAAGRTIAGGAVDISFWQNCCWQIRGERWSSGDRRRCRLRLVGAAAMVRRRSSAASYGVIDNDDQILQHRQWGSTT
jgi:hypothetical protein